MQFQRATAMHKSSTTLIEMLQEVCNDTRGGNQNSAGKIVSPRSHSSREKRRTHPVRQLDSPTCLCSSASGRSRRRESIDDTASRIRSSRRESSVADDHARSRGTEGESVGITADVRWRAAIQRLFRESVRTRFDCEREGGLTSVRRSTHFPAAIQV